MYNLCDLLIVIIAFVEYDDCFCHDRGYCVVIHQQHNAGLSPAKRNYGVCAFVHTVFKYKKVKNSERLPLANEFKVTIEMVKPCTSISTVQILIF